MFVAKKQLLQPMYCKDWQVEAWPPEESQPIRKSNAICTPMQSKQPELYASIPDFEVITNTVA